MSKQTAPPKGWGEVSREELIKREFEMVKRIEKEELTFDGLTPIEFALRELYEFQEATGCDTAAEFKTNLEKDTDGYMQKVIDALYENGDPVSVEAAELFEHMAQQRLKPVAWGEIEAIANKRYKVVQSHDSMFYRYAVVAGDGTRQVYLGREVECENMARKFAGAFLDGAFAMKNYTTPPYVATPRQRTWVGLTDEDKKEYVAQDFGGNRLDAMDWAEKRLKEKNT